VKEPNRNQTSTANRLQRFASKVLPLNRLPARLWWRLTARRRARNKRKLWTSPRRVDGAAMPSGFSPSRARQLWPGACQPALWADAPERWGDSFTQAQARSADAAAGTFDLLGSGPTSVIDPAGGVAWHCDFKSGAEYPPSAFYMDLPRSLGIEGTDIKVPWELSRFQHVFGFLWTGSDDYEQAFLDQWRNWMEANPVGRGVNWACAMDVALRAVSWTAALACWWDRWDEPTRRAMWAGLVEHGHFIRGNLEWSPVLRTNHYFSDITGLAVIAAVLGGYPPAGEWARFAAGQLHRETLAQFAPDGMDRECSTPYHRLMVELATLGILACRVSGCDLPKASLTRIARAYQAISVLAGSSRRQVLIGDNDSGRVFPMVYRPDADVAYMHALGRALFPEADLPGGPASPELGLLFGGDAVERAGAGPAATGEPGRYGAALTDSGLFVLGTDMTRMVMRCGPLGYKPISGHMHIDQLSVCLSVAGQEILVDSGQAWYTPRPAQGLYYRSTAAHNTVTVDGQLQTWVRTDRIGYCYAALGNPDPVCEVFDVTSGGARFVGRHRGYRRLPGGGDHRREVAFQAAGMTWAVTDTLELQGDHEVVWRLHLHPEVRVDEQGERWLLERGDVAVTLQWVRPEGLTVRLEQGWYSPGYGCEEPTRTLVMAGRLTGTVEAGFVLGVCGKDPHDREGEMR